ncbi:MAG: putative anti-sigma regulatory factor, serine/threonine protein kinase [Frankiales bacterium]|nr:putative anti-sigma regulatory factor, serine/threonine protein kinase [Frankiales bacterium]
MSTGLPVLPPSVTAGARRERCVLPGEAASVPQARRFVRQVLERWERGEYDEAGTLLCSELVSNAVLHARSEVAVELVDTAEGVLLEVTDDSAMLPVVRRHSREAGTGRGLWLLDQYSAGHGVDVTRAGTGKTVWALLCPEVQAGEEGADAALAMWLDQVEGL